MTWPTALTTNASVLKHSYVQGLDRLLEAGNNYTALHEGVALEIRQWLEGEGGIPNADWITNPEIFADIAVYKFLQKIYRGKGEFEQSEQYRRDAEFQIKKKQAKISPEATSGGITAKVVVIKNSDRTYYNGNNTGIFGGL